MPVKCFGDQMVDNYDKPLHAPLRWKTMESPARDLDEARVDAAIADILGDGVSAAQKDTSAEHDDRSEFPELSAQDTLAAPTPDQNSGVAAIIRQKWAEFSGAA